MSRSTLTTLGMTVILVVAGWHNLQPCYVAPGAILGPLARIPVLGLIEYRLELERLADIARDQQAEIDDCLLR